MNPFIFPKIAATSFILFAVFIPSICFATDCSPCAAYDLPFGPDDQDNGYYCFYEMKGTKAHGTRFQGPEALGDCKRAWRSACSREISALGTIDPCYSL